MIAKMTRTHAAQVAVIGLVIQVAACRDDEPKVKYNTVSGTVVQIDVKHRRLAVRFLNEKSGTPREIEGDVPAECEILINGRLAELSEIRVGEHVVVHGQDERGSNFRRLSALKIQITRDEKVTFGNPAPGTTQ